MKKLLPIVLLSTNLGLIATNKDESYDAKMRHTLADLTSQILAQTQRNSSSDQEFAHNAEQYVLEILQNLKQDIPANSLKAAAQEFMSHVFDNIKQAVLSQIGSEHTAPNVALEHTITAPHETAPIHAPTHVINDEHSVTKAADHVTAKPSIADHMPSLSEIDHMPALEKPAALAHDTHTPAAPEIVSAPAIGNLTPTAPVEPEEPVTAESNDEVQVQFNTSSIPVMPKMKEHTESKNLGSNPATYAPIQVTGTNGTKGTYFKGSPLGTSSSYTQGHVRINNKSYNHIMTMPAGSKPGNKGLAYEQLGTIENPSYTRLQKDKARLADLNRMMIVSADTQAESARLEKEIKSLQSQPQTLDIWGVLIKNAPTTETSLNTTPTSLSTKSTPAASGMPYNLEPGIELK